MAESREKSKQPVLMSEWSERLSLEIQQCITRDGEEDPPGSIANILEHEREQIEEAGRRNALEEHANRPRIICLCGSTRFIEQFAVKTWELELEGYIVLGCTLLPKWYCPVRDHFAESLGVKEQRDNHHLQKIDLADEVLVLNVGGYIGESTRSEIAYAESHNKPVRYLEAVAIRALEEKGE